MAAYMVVAGPSSPRRVARHATAIDADDLTDDHDSCLESASYHQSQITMKVPSGSRIFVNDADNDDSSIFEASPQDDSEGESDEYVDEDEDESESDDDITLLPTTRSKSLSPAKLASTNCMLPSDEDSTFLVVSPLSDMKGRCPSHRSPLQRLSAYIDTFLICQEQDLPDVTSDQLLASDPAADLPVSAQAFFQRWKGTFIPSPDVFTRVITLVRSCTSRPTAARGRHEAGRWTKNGESDETDSLDAESVARFIKTIHHAASKRGHAIDPFPLSLSKTPERALTRKRKTGSTRAKSKKARTDSAIATGTDAGAEVECEGEQESRLESGQVEVTSDLADRLGDLLYSARAVECSLTLLAFNDCDESLRCDEIVTCSLQVTRNIIDNFFLPFVRASTGTNIDSIATLSSFIDRINGVDSAVKTAATSATIPSPVDTFLVSRGHTASLIASLQGILAKLQDLSNISSWRPTSYTIAVLMDSLVPVINVAEIKPTNASRLWASSLSGIRLSALRIVSSLNAKADDPDSTVNTILDHIASYSVSVPKKNKEGWLGTDRIQPMTALIVHLIQDSAEPCDRLHLAKSNVLGDSESEDGSEEATDDAALEEAPIDVSKLRRALDKPRDTAKLLAEGLLWRLKARKVTRKSSSTEVDLTSIFEILTKDLLLIMFSAEWPGAALLVSHLARLFCSMMEDRSSSPDIRGIALDFLGAMTATMRASRARLATEDDVVASSWGSELLRFHEIAESSDSAALEAIGRTYHCIYQYIGRLDRRDNSHTSAGSFIAAHHIVELACAHQKIVDNLNVASQSQEASETNEAGDLFLKSLEKSIRTALGWSSRGSNAQALPKAKEMTSTRHLFERLVHSFNFIIPSDVVCDKLIEASEGPVAANRSKALRAMSAISQADETFLQSADVRQAVQRCLFDESVHVRDGAVALLGRFVVAYPSYLGALFPSLRSKLDDSGLLVRKRTLRLMTEIYHTEDSDVIRIQASASIARCIMDEELSMQDMAIEAIVEIWFGSLPGMDDTYPTSKTLSSRTGQYSPSRSSPGASLEGAAKLLHIVVSVAELGTGKVSPLEQVLRRISRTKNLEALTPRVVTLVDQCTKIIVTQWESEGEEAMRHARTLSLLTRVIPSALSIRSAKELLQCISARPATRCIPILGQVLDGISCALPVLHKTAIAFARQLQAALRPLVSQPSPYLSILQELIRCYCLVVQHHTLDFGILIKTLGQCLKLARSILRKARTCKPVESIERDDAVIIRLTALLVEHGDFHKIKSQSRVHSEALREITSRDIETEACELFLQLYPRHGYATHALHALRSLFRGHPRLMVEPSASLVVHQILSEGPMPERAIILHAIADIMDRDEVKSMNPRKSATKECLVSASSDAPASFEVLRSYLKSSIALIAEPGVQPLVLQILQHAVLRGLCHPMECLAALVALQTLQENQVIQYEAQRLYKHLMSKTQSINFRYARCSREAWDFQAALKGILVRGISRSGQALFQPWYTVVREHQPKAARLELLRAYLKAFDINTSSTECSADDVHYARFMAENLVTLDLRSPEETNLVISALQDVILGPGSQIRLTAQEELEVEGEDVDEDEDGNRDKDEVAYMLALGRMATIVSLAVLARIHINSQRSPQNLVAQSTARLADLINLPGTSGKRVEGLRLARAELGHLDALLGSLEDDDDA